MVQLIIRSAVKFLDMVSWEYHHITIDGGVVIEEIDHAEALSRVKSLGLTRVVKNSDGTIWDSPTQSFKHYVEKNPAIKDILFTYFR